MAKGPKGERRPADLNKRAALIVSIAIGETTEPLPPRGRAGGRVGGKARAKALTPEQRSKISKKAAAKRWGK